uniref:Uncharacterized protein n=1 Tax=Acrobeloides nanus TaxID=290746 RepID=A0A914CPQ1_9BILA
MPKLNVYYSELHKEHDEGKPREGDLREHAGIIGGEEEHERINWRESSNRSRKTNEGEGDIFGDFDDHSESGSDSTQHKSQVETYCNTYQENYAFYCLGGIDEKSHLREHLRKFCPSFEINCPEKVAKYSKASTLDRIQEHKTSVTGAELNPFPNVAAIAE